MTCRLHLIVASILLFLLAGCSTTLKQQWYDFTAYYNTFYNTKQYFQEGEREFRRSLPEINPEHLIRIHPSPTGAGAAHFDRTIDTGAELLRRHARSGYVDRTLELIGAAYFYKQEYFSALETFQDLAGLTTSPELRQRAAAWRVRTYLELGLHTEAIRIAEREPDEDTQFSRERFAELQILLAQHSIQSGALERGAELLTLYLPDLENRERKARGYFLLGQVQERLGSFNASYTAYREVQEHWPAPAIEYYARLKEAALIRRVGNLEMSYQLLRSMERDDKYSNRRPEIRYEIAKTVELRGDPEGAIRIYQQVLRDPGRTNSGLTRAKTYYELAEIYRESFLDLVTAAAYYDSAAMQNPDPLYLPAEWDADERAASFREYVTVTREIAELDSLLQLGLLSPSDRESAIAEILLNLEEERRQEMSLSPAPTDRFVMEPEEEISLPGDTEAAFGFLNIRNSQRLQDERDLFRQQWGVRPLSDHWRRAEAIREFPDGFTESTAGRNRFAETQEQIAGQPEPGDLADLDISRIPVTEARQDSVRNRIIRNKYRLGNIFFIQLRMPERAAGYFQEVLDSEYAPELKPQALYALAEVARAGGREDESAELRNQLAIQYPDSDPAQRIRGQEGVTGSDGEVSTGNRSAGERFRMIQAGSEEPEERAEALYQLASDYPDQEETPYILYHSILSYIETARSREDFRENLEEWETLNREWAELRQTFFARQDSAYTMLEDPDLSDEERTYWEEISQSDLPEPGFDDLFPYRGELWDRVRQLLLELEQMDPDPVLQSRVDYLRDELNPPGEDQVL